MSGHSKWATTHRKKELIDAKRGAIFTKLANNIALAARQGGGDIEMNFKLRLAVDKAKEANMPKDNIERAIKKGTGELEGITIEEITYEGFGPAGSAFMVEVVSDNRNRTASEMKHLFSDFGGSIGTVGWQFEKRGIINIDAADYKKQKDNLELELIDAGADDIKEDEEVVEILTKVETLQKVREKLEQAKIKIKSAVLGWIPKEEVKLDDEARSKVEAFMEALDDNSDVQDFYTNVNLGG